MFRTRLLTAIVALPLTILAIVQGGLWFFAIVAAVLTAAVVEFCLLMQREGFRPAAPFAVALLWVFLIHAQFPALNLLGPGVSLVMMATLGWYMTHRQQQPTVNWALTVTGPFYVGWFGMHFILLRALPTGLWWTLTVLPAIWLADSAAYFVGRQWGRHKMAPTLSPGKTWEGWLGGILIGGPATAGLAALWARFAGPSAPWPIHGLLVGLTIATVAPLGDLAISMIKREVGVKDSGTLFPGHGGALDRVDSLLWAAVIGYYLALLLAG